MIVLSNRYYGSRIQTLKSTISFKLQQYALTRKDPSSLIQSSSVLPPTSLTFNYILPTFAQAERIWKKTKITKSSKR